MGTAAVVATTKNKNMTIRTNADEYQTIKDFAHFQGKSVSGFVMDAVWKQIEDWEDIKAAEDYLARKARGESHTIPHSEIVKKYG